MTSRKNHYFVCFLQYQIEQLHLLNCIGNKNIHRNIESKKRTILYSVKQGDNLYKISDIFDVSVESIKQINDFESSDLMPGQIIKIAIRAF